MKNQFFRPEIPCSDAKGIAKEIPPGIVTNRCVAAAVWTPPSLMHVGPDQYDVMHHQYGIMHYDGPLLGFRLRPRMCSVSFNSFRERTSMFYVHSVCSWLLCASIGFSSSFSASIAAIISSARSGLVSRPETSISPGTNETLNGSPDGGVKVVS